MNTRAVQAILGGILISAIVHMYLKKAIEIQNEPYHDEMKIRYAEPRARGKRCSRGGADCPTKPLVEDELTEYIRNSVKMAKSAFRQAKTDDYPEGTTPIDAKMSAQWGPEETDTSKQFEFTSGDQYSLIIPANSQRS